MSTLGERLKRERELRDITVEEISKSTKISIRFIEALERDDHDALPAGVFTRGFIRAYCQYIGINGEDMVNLYIQQSEDEPVREAESPEEADTETVWAGYTVPLFIAVIVVAAGAIAAGFYVSSRPAGKKPAVEEKAADKEQPVFEPEYAVESIPAVPETTEEETVEPAADEIMKLVITAEEESWVEVIEDGDVLLNRVLQAGDVRTYTGFDAIRLSVGNAGGVKVMVNGREMDYFGERGEVVKDIIIGGDNPEPVTEE